MRSSLSFALLLAAALAAAGGGRGAAAQSKPGVLTWNELPLEVVLYDLADASGASFVFAHRLVERLRVSAQYKIGDEPDAALADLLAGTGLRATRIRRGRYVIIEEPLNVALEPDDPAAYTGALDGRIVDAETGEPLWGAHAWLVDLELGGVADPDGQFVVPAIPTGEYVVRFSHVGYRPARTRLTVYPVSPQLPPVIRLQREVLTSDDATVRAGDVPEPTPGLTDLASRPAAALPVPLGEGDLVQTLDWLPGVTRAGAGGGELVVRGADPHLVRYLRDGVPFVQPWHAFGLFSAFQPESVRRVRFHRGALPAALGSGLAGVVEAETRDGLVEQPSGTAALSPVALRAVAEAPVSPSVGVFVGGRRSMLDQLFAPTLRREAAAVVLDPLGAFGASDDVRHRFHDAEARLTWAPTAVHRLAIGGYLGADRLDARLPDSLDPVADPRLDVRHAWRNRLGSVHYRLLGRRAFVTATGYHVDYASDEATDARSPETRPFASVLDIGFRETGLRLDVDYFVSLAHEVRFGAHIARQGLDASLLETLDAGRDGEQRRAESLAQTGTEASLYVQEAWKPDPRVHVQAGLRADAYLTTGDVSLSPRLAVRWTAQPERLHLRAGVSRQVQPLHRVRDRYAYTYDLATSRWLLPSDVVRPAASWQVGAGAEWAPLGAEAPVALAFSADAYGRYLRDVLEPIDPFGVGEALAGPGVSERDLLRFYRPARGRAAGLEVAARAERGPWVLGLSYALSRAEVRVPGVFDWQPSRYDRPHVLGLLAQHRSARWSAAARLTVQSGLPTADAAVPRVLARFPTEVRLDLALGYRFRWLGLQWDAQAQAFNLSGARPEGIPPFADGTAALLATDVRGLPVIPVLSLKASW